MQAFLQGTSKLHSSPLASTESKLSSILPSSTPAAGKKELPILSDSFQHVCGQKETLHSDKDAAQKENSIQGLKELPAEGFHHVCGKTDAPPVADKEEDLDSLQPDSLTSGEHKDPENQADCRPRSPAHETSIIVPSISWDNVKEKQDDMDSDSLSSDVSIGVEGIDEDEEGFEEERPKAPSPTLPPRVEIHNSSGELLSGERQAAERQAPQAEQPAVPPKSLQLKPTDSPTASRRNQIKAADNHSGRSSPLTPTSLCGEVGQAALTETELSDWAGDAGVSEDLEDVEFVINPEYVTLRRHQKPKDRKGGRGAIRSLPVRIATGEDFGDFEDQIGHVCGKTDDFPGDRVQEPTALKSFEVGENIEYMDTGEEGVSVAEDVSSSSGKVPIANRGYVHFVDVGDREVVEAANHALIQMHSGEGYVPLKNNEDEEEDATTPVADANMPISSHASSTENSSSSTSSATPSSVQNHQGTSSTAELITDEVHHDDESHPMEALTTTEDTTTSDATTVVDAHAGLDEESGAYQECMKRLQGRVSPFVNMRDSIDARKARKSSKSSLEAEPIAMKSPEPPTTPVNTTANSSKSPTTCRKLEQISQERSKQKSLIHDLVMDKVLSQKKLHERKPRKSIRSTPSPLAGSLSHGCIPLLQKDSPEGKPEPQVASPAKTPTNEQTPFVTPNTSTQEEFMTALKSFKKRATSETRPRPISVHGLRPFPMTVDRNPPLPDTPLTHPDGFSMPDIRKALFRGDSCSSIGTPRNKNDDRERARLDARVRAQLKTDEELGLSPEDYIRALKEKASRKPEAEADLRSRHDGSASSVSGILYFDLCYVLGFIACCTDIAG